MVAFRRVMARFQKHLQAMVSLNTPRIFICILLSCISPALGRTSSSSSSMVHGIVVDAGSSGSRIRVYQWAERMDASDVPDITETYSYKIKPGISSFVDDTEGLHEHVLSLLDEAKNNVPDNQHEITSIYFLATAGMRLLTEGDANALMAETNRILEDKHVNPFKYSPQNCRIISGEEEGAFAWITVNYLRGFFNGGNTESAGVLELGGASTQIAFMPSGSILANKFPVKVGSIEYPLYVHSYLFYGQEAALEWAKEYLVRMYPNNNTIDHPCVLREDNRYSNVSGKMVLFRGVGDFDGCEDLVNKYVYESPHYRCYPKPCALGTVYQPSIDEMKQYYAIGAFLFPVKAFQLPKGTIQPEQLFEGARYYCSLDFATGQNISGEADDFVSANCMIGIYSFVLWTKAYGFEFNTEKISAIDYIDGEELSWTLGAILYETSKQEIEVPCAGGVIGGAHAQTIPSNLAILLTVLFILVWKNVLQH